MIYFICFIFGVLPSIVWLLFFLREDVHPESNRMILKVFGYGVLSAFLAALLEINFQLGLNIISLPFFLSSILQIFLGISLIEELMKYLVVKKAAISDPEFDEPLDAMLYMIIAGLGFAAIENILYLLPFGQPFRIMDTMVLSLFRFLGATFLHALCSGTIGFFLALSFRSKKPKKRLILFGIFLATFLHGLYNFSIIKFIETLNNFLLLIPALILIGLAVFIFLAFQKLKKLSSACKLK
ncbi:MAG: PrsW family intramembrane metalloprotease [Candidatus Nealsonbacteria bacterium]|nr:PrsW family intramembrane metalloprotease [Candidatus Nealsonbacteria bacterium]